MSYLGSFVRPASSSEIALGWTPTATAISAIVIVSLRAATTEDQSFMSVLIQDSVFSVNSTLQQSSVEVDLMDTLGERLRHAREARGWDQPELSRQSGVKVSTISEIEQGRIKRSTFAHNLATALGIRVEWLQDNDGPMPATAIAETRPSYRADELQIPQLDVAAGMALAGRSPTDHLDIVNQVRVNLPQLRREVSFSRPNNLRIITGYGDSMEPTFKDGDPLLIDVGVEEIAIDGVYVLEREGELFIKRVQRHPIDKTLIVSSDNRNYQPYVVSDAERVSFKICGRVLLAWTSKRL